MKKLALLMGIFMLFGPLAAAAAPKAGDSVEIGLDVTRVTAPPIVQSVTTDDYAQEKVTVSDQQVQDLNAGDLTTALRRTPGVTISRYNLVGAFGGGDGGAIYVRGTGAARPGAELSVMFDGAPKANSIWTHPLMDTVNTDVAGQIVVYRSPQPALIGNMASAAVDVIPKRMTEPGRLLRVSTAGGTYATSMETTEGGLMSGPWDVYFVQSIRESEGHRDQAWGRTHAYYLGTGYCINPNWYVAVKALHTDGSSADPGPDNAPPPKRNTFNNQNDTITLAVHDHFEWGEGYIKGFVDRGGINWQEPADDSNTSWQNYGLRSRQTVQLGPVELMGGVDGTFLGAEWVQGGLDGKRIASVPYMIWHLWEPYAGVSLQLGDREGFYFIPSYAYRWLQHSEFENKEAWQAGAVAGYDFIEVHANWAHGYNYPGQYTRAYYSVFWAFAYNGDEWKDLEPEEINHWETGIQLKAKDKAKLNVTYYQERSENRLQIVTPPPPPPRLVQIGELNLSGMDTTLTLTPIPEVAVYLGWSNIWADKPHRVARAPESTVSAGVDALVLDNVKVNVDYQNVAEQYVYNSRNPGKNGANIQEIDGYELYNAKLSYLFDADKVSGNVWVAGENLGDEDYEYLPDYPMPGTTWMGGVTVNYK
jgi:iron complex outermembrane receptor protein